MLKKYSCGEIFSYAKFLLSEIIHWFRISSPGQNIFQLRLAKFYPIMYQCKVFFTVSQKENNVCLFLQICITHKTLTYLFCANHSFCYVDLDVVYILHPRATRSTRGVYGSYSCMSVCPSLDTNMWLKVSNFLLDSKSNRANHLSMNLYICKKLGN